MIITAVDVDDGAFVSWGVAAGVSLVRAAAASSAVPGIFPPITIAGHRYMDGAMRSPTSADLATGSDLVIIVAAPSRSEQSDRQIAAETADIRAAGGEIIEIRPDAESGAAFGPDAMDSSRQPLVFGAGLRQGRAAASDVAARVVGQFHDALQREAERPHDPYNAADHSGHPYEDEFVPRIVEPR